MVFNTTFNNISVMSWRLLSWIFFNTKSIRKIEFEINGHIRQMLGYNVYLCPSIFVNDPP
jgi:hypothetical protein